MFASFKSEYFGDGVGLSEHVSGHFFYGLGHTGEGAEIGVGGA